MLVPSRLNEYPVGTTSPTTDLEQLSRSSFSIKDGSALSDANNRKAEQDRKQQHLQDLAGRERADHGVGNDVEEEIDGLLRLGLFGVGGHRLRVGRGAAKTCARPHQIADDKPNHQREG